ncbi:MerR family transcriptional regulator [Kineosporia sp. NBRC 101731]|uniref:MerR family transcriptional regulator n=1 Tax=Kineosporia sp. NBRC 101731 TaxID=3032199 RepID=UPI0024A36166|nr:MerR family transcriptional regulator [Kineosporia sp. NBRC 101731]GLY29407.1 MerR family transcriptional regulator [Kineosporia sp. NBRC 101731]
MTTTSAAPASDVLSIGEISAQTGLSAHTLRFYEQENLFVNPVARDGSGRRVYGRQDVQWLLLATRLRDSGMPLAEIARYAALVRAGAGNEQERLALLREHQGAVRAQMERLAASLDAVSLKISLYEGALAEGDPQNPWAQEGQDCAVPAPPVRSGRQQPPHPSRRR